MGWESIYLDYIDDAVFFPIERDSIEGVREEMREHPDLQFSLEEYPRKAEYLINFAALDMMLTATQFDAATRRKDIMSQLVHDYNTWAHYYDTAARRLDIENQCREELEYMSVDIKVEGPHPFWTRESEDEHIVTIDEPREDKQ